MAHDQYPKGAGGLGQLGEGVDVDFVMANGSRSQRRRIERHLKREAAKVRTNQNVKGGKK